MLPYPKIRINIQLLFLPNRSGGVMVSVLASSAVDRGFICGVMFSVLASSVVDRGFGQTNDYKIDNCCFSAKHITLRCKSKNSLVQSQNYVSEWSDMSIYGLLFQ